jgi:hypothetical protein
LRRLTFLTPSCGGWEAFPSDVDREEKRVTHGNEQLAARKESERRSLTSTTPIREDSQTGTATLFGSGVPAFIQTASRVPQHLVAPAGPQNLLVKP